MGTSSQVNLTPQLPPPAASTPWTTKIPQKKGCHHSWRQPESTGNHQHVRHPLKEIKFRGAQVAQSVKHLTSAQIMISRFVSLSPVLSSVLTAQSLEPALDSVSPSLCAPPLLALSHSLSQINIKFFLILQLILCEINFQRFSQIWQTNLKIYVRLPINHKDERKSYIHDNK